ncbi:MAG: lipase maturation factor family protein [Candidatus Melainabacteria bacterium]|mgnify:CR=1 FL=1|jgi:lipase maturation factor 1|nr:lipase maturation factor family protein [Candidatus Melainabacteria bacterium]
MNPLVQNLFIRSLGFSYLLAFASLLSQIKGLIGSTGILPATEYLTILKTKSLGFFNIPSIFWFDSSDNFMVMACLLGILVSFYLVIRRQKNELDLVEFASLLTLYLIYLSFVNTSRDFLSFQWDVLLLEVGFLTSLFSLFKTNEFASNIFKWLFRLLLFKLIFMSGLVKISSNDPTWSSLKALDFHYYTQPLPNPLSYLIHQLPSWFHKLSIIIMFVIELLFPFFIFCRKNLRELAAWGFMALQLIIIMTGNYCFFNILSIFLCLWLFDDSTIKRLIPESLEMQLSNVRTVSGSLEIISSFIKNRLDSVSSIDPGHRLRTKLIKVLIIAFAVLTIFLDCYFIFSRSPIKLKTRLAVVRKVSPLIQPLRYYFINNAYGLFANMTTSRKEIIIQGANEDLDWQEYEFKYKPQNPQECPRQVAPHQPRLDWQMWFAALKPRPSPWFMQLIGRLLNNEKEVINLIKTNPFPDKAPKYIRALLYDYQFTSLDEYSKTQNFWKPKLLGAYLPKTALGLYRN